MDYARQMFWLGFVLFQYTTLIQPVKSESNLLYLHLPDGAFSVKMQGCRPITHTQCPTVKDGLDALLLLFRYDVDFH